MAAEVGQPFSGWSHSDSPYNDLCTQDDSVQKMVLDHGSVSFGRFAEESLSWENRSVFGHNRRQEEISKLTLPGLVAQKKAYFEEYYKRKAQKAKHLTEATSEERSNDDTLDHSKQEDNSHAVVPEDPVDTAPSFSCQPSTEVSSSDENKHNEPHGLGYLTFNPLFSRITEEASSTGQNQHVDGEFCCATRTRSKHGLNHETMERKVLAPKHVVSTDYGESNVAASRIILPIASLKAGVQKQEPRKNIVPAAVNGLTKGTKDPSSCLIQIPRVHLRRNSENVNYEGLKDPFHKRVEMKLRALSDRMSADRAAASSRSSPYPNADRAAIASRSALCQNTDRFLAPSKSATQASHKSSKEVQPAATLPRTNFYNKGSCVSHVASSNSSTTGKLATRSSVMPNSSQNNAKPLQTAQVASKRGAGLTSTSNGSQNKRKQLSTPAASVGNSQTKGSMYMSIPTSARSSGSGIQPYKAAKAPRISNRRNTVAKTQTMQKLPTYETHSVGGRNVLSKVAVNGNENRKVISPRDGNRSNLARKSKPRQERPQWR
ncbi:hypothetical protein D1007_37783 [Hordeum vulgare]|uniref:TPX2 C-terminal domain-containing protein n=1 Tax=Hordeum vulgare subsp. vulgare TaxID=112509 RepID=M0WYP6_HORVV|nr:uncharacterized protein LOC123402010 [Hordeum vulgare subsp. vulgare]KAE8788181.1 hypothetical protein D1007_37783 [Hordeum vulgare]